MGTKINHVFLALLVAAGLAFHVSSFRGIEVRTTSLQVGQEENGQLETLGGRLLKKRETKSDKKSAPKSIKKKKTGKSEKKKKKKKSSKSSKKEKAKKSSKSKSKSKSKKEPTKKTKKSSKKGKAEVSKKSEKDSVGKTEKKHSKRSSKKHSKRKKEKPSKKHHDSKKGKSSKSKKGKSGKKHGKSMRKSLKDKSKGNIESVKRREAPHGGPPLKDTNSDTRTTHRSSSGEETERSIDERSSRLHGEVDEDEIVQEDENKKASLEKAG